MMRSADWTAALSLGDTPVQPHAHTTSGQHSFNAVALLYIHIKGVGIQPFADGVSSPSVRFDNYTWYFICFYHAAGSFLKLHVGDVCVCALQLSKYCKIKSVTENGFWAEKGWCLAVPEEHYFRGVKAHRIFSLFLRPSQSIRWPGLSPSYFTMCIPGVWVGIDKTPRTLRPCTHVCTEHVKSIRVKLRPRLSSHQDCWYSKKLLYQFRSLSYSLLYPSK